jgi:hypothetical protein
MKALAFLMGSRALDAALAAGDRRPIPEPDLAPMATTPETAGAWRRWAEAGRSPSAGAARATTSAGTLQTPTAEPA